MAAESSRQPETDAAGAAPTVPPNHSGRVSSRPIPYPHRLRAGLALLLLLPAPSLGAYMFLVVAPGTALGGGVYAFAKVFLLVFPLLWFRFIEGGSWSSSPLPPPRRRQGILFGVVSGGLLLAAIVGAHALLGDAWVGAVGVLSKAREGGFDRWERYLLLASYLSFVNSLLEEYVWRWFVFTQFERLVGRAGAIVLAALAFTVHHVFALAAQFEPRVVVLGSAGVFVGSLLWSWCYGRYRSIWPGYLSHVGADIGVFVVGARLLFGGE